MGTTFLSRSCCRLPTRAGLLAAQQLQVSAQGLGCAGPWPEAGSGGRNETQALITHTGSLARGGSSNTRLEGLSLKPGLRGRGYEVWGGHRHMLPLEALGLLRLERGK